MRKINSLIIHCSATPPKMDIGVKEIRQWHISKGWSDIGYHVVIRRNGKIETGRPLEKAGAHCRGKNKHSIGICLIGGINKEQVPRNNFTKAQFKTLEKVVKKYDMIYDGLDIRGHSEFSKKACPSFNVQTWLKLIEKKETKKEIVIKKAIVKKSWWKLW